MTIHTCKRCKNQYYTKDELQSHQQRKKKCEPNETTRPDKILSPCVCICEKKLSCPKTLKAHRKKCYVYIHGIPNTNTNITTRIGELSIVPYSDPFVISYLNHADQAKLLNIKDNPQLHLTLFELTRCATDKEQFHNIHYTPNNRPCIWYYDGYSWQSDKMTDILSEIIKLQNNELTNFLQYLKFNIDPDTKKYIEKYINSINKEIMSPDDGQAGIKLLCVGIQQILIKKSKIISRTFTETKDNSLERSKLKQQNNYNLPKAKIQKSITESSDNNTSSNHDSKSEENLPKRKSKKNIPKKKSEINISESEEEYILKKKSKNNVSGSEDEYTLKKKNKKNISESEEDDNPKKKIKKRSSARKKDSLRKNKKSISKSKNTNKKIRITIQV